MQRYAYTHFYIIFMLANKTLFDWHVISAASGTVLRLKHFFLHCFNIALCKVKFTRFTKFNKSSKLYFNFVFFFLNGYVNEYKKKVF